MNVSHINRLLGLRAIGRQCIVIGNMRNLASEAFEAFEATGNRDKKILLTCAPKRSGALLADGRVSSTNNEQQITTARCAIA